MNVNRGIGLFFSTLVIVAGCSGKKEPPHGAPLDADAIALNNRGVGLMAYFDYEAAYETFSQVVEEHPGWADAQVNLAIATLNRQRDGDEDRALTILTDVIERQPENARARYCRAILLRYLGPPNDPEDDLRAALSVAPDDAHAQYFLAQTLMDKRAFEEALASFQRAIELDPYMRSGHFGAARALRALGRGEEAAEALATFDRLESNPRAHTVEFKYSRMGELAMTRAVGNAGASADRSPLPDGPIWAAPHLMAVEASWRRPDPGERISLTTADIDGDGDLDLFVANAIEEGIARNAVLLRGADGLYTLDAQHPLADTPDVRAALWGDYDNDGLTDVYLCRRGPNVLLRQSEANVWEDVTSSAGAAQGSYDTVDGAFVDADHDGDLDIFCVNANGPNELLNNNLDGTFRPIAAERGIDGGDRPSRQVVFADLDSDRDADIVVVNASPPHEVYINDRMWEYHAGTGFESFQDADVVSVVVADLDADGRFEIAGRERGARLLVWRESDDGVWSESSMGERDGAGLAAIDSDGDGSIDIETPDSFGWAWPQGSASTAARSGTLPEHWGWIPVTTPEDQGPKVVLYGAVGVEPGLYAIDPGSGRYAFANLAFSGREDQGQSMRSNASGIGVRYEARIGDRWTIGANFGASSGPGQSLQPTTIGLGGASAIDFVAMDWPDGVFQSELDLRAGSHSIIETQRQLSSCPLLFAWDGQEYRFISDILGVGGMGYALGRGVYSTPRPWEHFLFPEDSLAARDDRYVIKIGEPMEEVCYLDAARLIAYDLPPGWSMTLDERMATGEPTPSGEPVFYRSELLPSRAFDNTGRDRTADVAHADLRAAPVGALDERFIGRLADEHALTFEFDQAIDAGAGRPVLVIDGWVEYPYSQTQFAAWQAGAHFAPPTLEARSGSGEWVTVYAEFGYPAGMPRQMSVPLAGLPDGADAIRLRTNLEIYWDRVRVVYAEDCPDAARVEAPLVEARLHHVGFPLRETGPQRQPSYDYANREPFWDVRAMRGLYTRFGPIDELVREHDSALAIFGPGEEAHLEFQKIAEKPDGWSRRYVLETQGWCKDMDLFTQFGETVEPLPPELEGGQSRRGMHESYNVRMQSWR